MSDKYIITKEEINQILLHSPYALSLTPSKNGMSGEQTKKYFYDFIPVLVEKLNFKMKDVELSEIANEKMVDEIWEAINTLGADIVSAMSKATQAYNLASGKSKVYVWGNVRHLFGDILNSLNNEANNLRVGDFILITEKGFPDFIVSSSPDDVKIPPNGYVSVTAENYLDVEIKEGTTYAFLNGFSLVGIESGIDTSVFATKEALEAVEIIAKGATMARSFKSFKKVVEELSKAEPLQYLVGQHLYISAVNVPDVWIYEAREDDYVEVDTSIEGLISLESNLKAMHKIDVGYYSISVLETQKVDLTDYATKKELECKQDKLEFTDVVAGNIDRNLIPNVGAVNDAFNTLIIDMLPEEYATKRAVAEEIIASRKLKLLKTFTVESEEQVKIRFDLEKPVDEFYLIAYFKANTTANQAITVREITPSELAQYFVYTPSSNLGVAFRYWTCHVREVSPCVWDSQFPQGPFTNVNNTEARIMYDSISSRKEGMSEYPKQIDFVITGSTPVAIGSTFLLYGKEVAEE